MAVAVVQIIYSWFHIKGTWGVHSFNETIYLSLRTFFMKSPVFEKLFSEAANIFLKSCWWVISSVPPSTNKVNVYQYGLESEVERVWPLVKKNKKHFSFCFKWRWPSNHINACIPQGLVVQLLKQYKFFGIPFMYLNYLTFFEFYMTHLTKRKKDLKIFYSNHSPPSSFLLNENWHLKGIKFFADINI